jgi:hypothetical protein
MERADRLRELARWYRDYADVGSQKALWLALAERIEASAAELEARQAGTPPARTDGGPAPSRNGA